MYGEEILEAVDARELSVCTEDLCDTAADIRVDLAVDTLPGMLRVFAASELLRNLLLFNPNLIAVLCRFDSTYSDLSYVVVVVSEALILQEIRRAGHVFGVCRLRLLFTRQPIR
jgi:hypothetical protein